MSMLNLNYRLEPVKRRKLSKSTRRDLLAFIATLIGVLVYVVALTEW